MNAADNSGKCLFQVARALLGGLRAILRHGVS